MNGKPQFDEKNCTGSQKLVLDDRARLDLSGVCDVVSFDEAGALLKTVTGMLAIDGEELHVVKLDINGGNISIEGKINGFFFSDASGKNRNKRLFR